ncbi:terminase small subunit [Deinococcus alpinitundrae]|uniref:terminase small subunit n=1 Tax=Deinococcus alpinitundrae TaxID=468913 RepID=UPI001379B9FB|nr:terminase small subunit [Deinococcus alpinitundrae]
MTVPLKGRTPNGGVKNPKPEPTTFTEALAAIKNLQRRAFVVSYVERPNATRAAKLAGYSQKTAYSQGQRLLKDVEVSSAIRLGQEETAMPASEVKSRTSEVARATLEDFFTFDQRQHRPMQLRPVSELLTELFSEIAFEERFVKRAEFLGKKERADHDKAQAARKREALRMELEMEDNPKAKRWAPGPPVIVEVERLDLAKARDLGVLHLLKSLKYTQHGPAIELQSQEHARDQLGKLHGLWRDEPDSQSPKPDGSPQPIPDDDRAERLQAVLDRAKATE